MPLTEYAGEETTQERNIAKEPRNIANDAMNLRWIMLKKNPSTNYVFAPKNVGGNINTAESEYFPFLYH